jgi:hypothetical protein
MSEGVAIGRETAPQGVVIASDFASHFGEKRQYSLITTAKMNDVDPQAWLADVLARIADHSASRLDELLPWNRKPVDALAKQVQAA